jgi:NAD(P)-dependent dehydrogenase (short-subunit alcohol dehydrogenase family)
MARRPRTSLAGRSVLITGAARGIGAELARKAAARGARIALVGLEPHLLARVADELGPEHLWVEADVTDPEALAAAVRRTVETFGGLDVVVANAGIAPLTTVATSSAHALARTIEVNLTGDADRARGAPGDHRPAGAHPADQLGGGVHGAARHERLLRRQGRARALR